MNNENTELELVANNQLVGLFDLIKTGGFLSSWIINLIVIISLIPSILIVSNNKIDLYSYINEVITLLYQLIPNLLGFTIAGYSFLMAFIPLRLMERITLPMKNSSVSLYQKITSSLALNILQHAIILVLGYIIHIIIFIQTNKDIVFTSTFVNVHKINCMGIFIVNMMLATTLGVVIQIIVSSFNLAQLYHFDVNRQMLENKNEPS